VRVDCHDNLRNPASVKCSRVVLYDDDGHPIFVALTVGNDIIMSCAGDADFEATLRNLGIKSTLIVTTVSNTSPLSKNVKLLP
jgi:hypothetical protein